MLMRPVLYSNSPENRNMTLVVYISRGLYNYCILWTFRAGKEGKGGGRLKEAVI